MILLDAVSDDLKNEADLLPYPDLPNLPRIIKYWDDFSEKTYSLNYFDEINQIKLKCDGREFKWDLVKFNKEHLAIIKHVFAFMVDDLDLSSVAFYMGSLLYAIENVDVGILDVFVKLSPDKVKSIWDLKVFPKVSNSAQANALKRVLHALCAGNVGYWNPGCKNFVSNLRAPILDPYRVVRSRDCFIPVEQQQ